MISFKDFLDEAEKMKGKDPCWSGYEMIGMKMKNGRKVPNCVPKNEGFVSHAQRKAVWATRKDGGKGHPDKKTNEEIENHFDLIEQMVEQIALDDGIDSETLWEMLEEVSDEELFEYAIDKKGHKSSEGGLTQKGVDAYNRKTGGNLQTAVTTPPSKLDPDSKAAKRRKSFCARMGGMKKRLTSAKTARDPDSRINKALRKWNC